jgi:tetratricopeptide (TPR) repeat protein
LRQLSPSDRASRKATSLLCQVHGALGRHYRHNRELEQAAEHLTKARVVAEELVAKHPELIDLRSMLADTQLNLGIVRGEQGQHEEELQLKSNAAEILRVLVESFPESIKWREQWCFALESRGRALRSLDRIPEACDAIRVAIQAIEAGAQRFPESPEFAEMACTAYRSLGKTYLDQGDLENAEGTLMPAVEWAQRLTDKYPVIPEHLHTSSIAYLNASRLRAAQNRLDNAFDLLDRGLPQVERAAQSIPTYRTSVTWFHGDRCKLYCRLNQHDRALEAAEAIRQVDRNSADCQMYAAEALATCLQQIDTSNADSMVLHRPRYVQLALDALGQSIELGATPIDLTTTTSPLRILTAEPGYDSLIKKAKNL